MKKFYSLYVLVAIFFAACSPPQVTVTLPPAPAPTPTPHPKFAALQQTIAASGTRYTLNGGDGLIYDGETPIPGVTVAPDGTMTLTVNGETVTLDPTDVNLDDQNGISIDGYDFQDTDGDGIPDSWVEANETVTMGGVILTLDENGVVTDMEATGTDAETKADNLANVDPAAWGLEVGDGDGQAQIVKGPDGTNIKVDGKDVAKWVGTEWEWDWAALNDLGSGNPLFELAMTWKMDGTNPIDKESAERDSAILDSFASSEAGKQGNKPMVSAVYVFSDDKREAIGGFLIAGTNVTSSEDAARVDRTKGKLCFITDNGDAVSVKIKNFDSEIRYWR